MTTNKRNPFRLKEVRGLKPEFIGKLKARGIKSAAQRLIAGRTRDR